jgi:riboflavin biosynthesis pyrimidine reductase
MSEQILEIYPDHGRQHDLKGLYLQQNLREQVDKGSLPFVYANFISSLDGRIAIPHSEGGLTVPEGISNPRDWRLFQELAIQADILLSSGRYLREYAEERAQEILQIYTDPNLADLADWRLANGLDRFPHIAVISASLDFPIPTALIQDGRRVIVLTTEGAPEGRIQELRNLGLKVISAGKTQVMGDAVVKSLADLGYGMIYSAAGPRVLHLLLDASILNRLYLTFAARVLGGEPYSSIIEGPLLPSPAEFNLEKLYLDLEAPGLGGQLFATYDSLARD